MSARWSRDSKLQEIILKCKKEGKPFVDPDFPPDDSSLYISSTRPPKEWPKVTEWKRANQLGTRPQLFVSGVEAGDVIQGVLGDCWFLGALSVVATKPDLLMKNFCQKELNEQGVYEFNFYKNGDWIKVVIDDLIPCHRGKPIFGRCLDINEVWVMLIEKAYAKLHKTYENLEGGAETFALVDLTGGAPETISFDSTEGKQLANNGKLWPKIIKYNSLGYLLGCAMLIPDGQAEANTGKGILQNHAYGIIDAKDINGNRLLRIRNPWGQGEWKGRWSDGSKEFTPEILAKLNYKFEDDGTFWMELSDFLKQFNRFYVVRLFNKDWQHSVVKSEWKGVTAGGCGNFPTWKNNPQYGFDLKIGDEVFITLMQDDVRINGVRDSPINIGFILLKVADLSKKIETLKGPDVLGQTVFNNSREVSKKFNLKSGSYVIVPSTFYPNKCTTFILRVYCKGSDPVLLFNLLEAPQLPNRFAATQGRVTSQINEVTQSHNKNANTKTTNSSNNISDMSKPFEGVATRKFPPNRPPNPLYQKSSDVYGKREPTEHEKNTVYHGKKHIVTKHN